MENLTFEQLPQAETMLTKKVLTFTEAANYMGISKSCLYKMTMNRTIPHYKPNGKMIYFEREEIEAY